MRVQRSGGDATPAEGVVVSRVFDAPRDLVFEVWTHAEHFTRWFGPHGAEIVACELDARPGGIIRFGHCFPEGTVYVHGNDAKGICDMTAKLIYFATRSLDGYVEDAQGKIDFTEQDEASQKAVNDALRPTGTYLYGRRMYETMLVWNQFGAPESDPPWARAFGSTWRAAEKVIYSKTLKQLSMPMARLESTFDADAVRDMKLRATQNLVIGGHELASHAFRAGLVDEIKLFIAPIIVGGGKRSFPDGVRLGLELVDEQRFDGSGIVHVHYRVRSAGAA